jgi:hypothetical protein
MKPMRGKMARKKHGRTTRGKLRIGNSWNAITIIALSQSSPLKAVAEFVENCIDAQARNITIVRGKKQGQAFLRITDDGQGIPLDQSGVPDFKYVATHICDSIKRQLKDKGASGIQGEYGIGLLSFWTVGEELTLTSAAKNGTAYSMNMAKGDPGYSIRKRRALFPQRGTELLVHPLLPGLKQLSGEKMQWYLASELRDRLRKSGVNVKIIDRQARKELQVEPRRFSGWLLHDLPAAPTPHGDVYVELYLDAPQPEHRVGLYRSGTRVLADIASLDRFQAEPWNSGYLQGILDASFLTLTPGTRGGIIQDRMYEDFCAALAPLEEKLVYLIEEQRRAEEERASRKILRSVQSALREALLALPSDEYDWFEVRAGDRSRPQGKGVVAGGDRNLAVPGTEAEVESRSQKSFFDYAGPLFSVRIAPASCVIPVRGEKNLRAVPRDRARRLVEENLHFAWQIVEGDGTLSSPLNEITTFTAPTDPGLTQIKVQVRQGEIEVEALGNITITDTLVPEPPKSANKKHGLPGYTFHKAPGELWRSRYDEARNIIVINNGHRDFVYASRSRARKIRYICKLFAKELVALNFPGLSAGDLLERMVELSMYTEENLK